MRAKMVAGASVLGLVGPEPVQRLLTALGPWPCRDSESKHRSSFGGAALM